MLAVSSVALVALLGSTASALHAGPNMANMYKRNDANAAREFHLSADNDVSNVNELFMDIPIDHFTGNNINVQNYKMRYLIDESFVQKGEQYPPILFYCGNEGDVWTFYNNTGFMTQYLPSVLKGVVLFGEHRFYGKSLPFGDQSFDSKENVRFLTVDQTLMDYVILIKAIKAANPLYA